MDLEALRLLDEAATPGPWRWEDGNTDQVIVPLEDEYDYPMLRGADHETVLYIDDFRGAEDAELIPAMRNALPDLLKRIGELEQLLYDIGFCPHCRGSMPCMGCTL